MRKTTRAETSPDVSTPAERSLKKSLQKRSHYLGVPVTTLRKYMKSYLDLKAYRPSFVNELSDVDMQKCLTPVSKCCVLLNNPRTRGSGFL
jgi:hypothetical protein